jgi:hypothetical protein
MLNIEQLGESMDIRSLKLTTGEELIAEIVKETGLGYMIKNPLVVHMMRKSDGGANLGFATYSLLHDPKAIIEIFYHGLIAAPVQVLGEVENSYITNVSGIVLPTAPSGRILHG